MAKEKKKIKVISYVYVGEVLTPVADLNEEQKERLAIAIQYGLLSSQFAGVAEFYAPGFEIGKDQHGRTTVKRLATTPEAV